MSQIKELDVLSELPTEKIMSEEDVPRTFDDEQPSNFDQTKSHCKTSKF